MLVRSCLVQVNKLDVYGRMHVICVRACMDMYRQSCNMIYQIGPDGREHCSFTLQTTDQITEYQLIYLTYEQRCP